LQDIQTGQRILHEPVYSIGLLMAGILWILSFNSSYAKIIWSVMLPFLSHIWIHSNWNSTIILSSTAR
jgi:hypothetical protein